MLTRVLPALLFATTAHAQSYLVESTPSAAQARSQAQCAAVNCDGVHTIFWWPVVTLTNGQGAVVILSAPYGQSASVTVNGVPQSGALTAQEIGALETPTQIAPLLPVVVGIGGTAQVTLP
jgi:hypothetical protein